MRLDVERGTFTALAPHTVASVSDKKFLYPLKCSVPALLHSEART